MQAAYLVLRKNRIERKDSRNTCQKKLLNLGLAMDLSVINLSSFCPCILDPFWPLCISMKNTVRSWTSAHLSCSAILISHSCSKGLIYIHYFTFHTVNFLQDPLLWVLCPLLSTRTAFSQDIYIYICKILLNSALSMMCCHSTVHICYFSNWLVWHICYFKMKCLILI